MMRPATTLDTGDDRLGRAVAKVREQVGDDADVAWLLDRLDAAAARRLFGRRKRGGTSARWAAAITGRNEPLQRLRVSLCPALRPSAAASLIVAKFLRYESVRWPDERDALVAPLDEPARTFWTILRDHEVGGPKMPNVRQLTTILKKT